MKSLLVLPIIAGALCALACQPINPIRLDRNIFSCPVLVKPTIKRINWEKIAVEKIKSFESYREKPYKCPAGVLTVGYGHTGKNASMRMSKAKAEAVLMKELEQRKSFVLSCVTVPLTEYQLWALISFTHNTNESCLRKLVSGPNRLNSGNYNSVVNIMPLYNKAAGKTLRGLSIRRAEEVRMWQGYN